MRAYLLETWNFLVIFLIFKGFGCLGTNEVEPKVYIPI